MEGETGQRATAMEHDSQEGRRTNMLLEDVAEGVSEKLLQWPLNTLFNNCMKVYFIEQ